jgi:hypothetical protein
VKTSDLTEVMLIIRSSVAICPYTLLAKDARALGHSGCNSTVKCLMISLPEIKTQPSKSTVGDVTDCAAMVQFFEYFLVIPN